MTKQGLIEALIGRLIAPLAPLPPPPADPVFNPALAQALALDPAATALLSDMPLPLAVDSARPEMFRVTRRGTLLLSPGLIARPALIGAVARWAEETAFLVAFAGADREKRGLALAAAARHGAALIARLSGSALADARLWLPEPLWSGGRLAAGPATAEWLAEAMALGDIETTAAVDLELALPVEALLEAGGDARIATAVETGMNRYGATSRPRPEAVHFSSSTASSVSDYAFAALDRLRRALLVATLFGGLSAREASERLADAVGGEILKLIELEPEEADVILCASGTDAEHVAVLIALAESPRLANLVIAPEETGRSVKIAAAGRYFQEGAPMPRGEKIWPDADIAVVSAAVRDAAGKPLAASAIEREIAAKVETALGEGRRVLLHALFGSKTGVSAPSPSFIAVLGAPSPAIDVVVDSCQWRVGSETLGAHVRAGWMVQLSGSKFFTGPPFSGALVAPARYRERTREVARLRAEASGLTPSGYWSPAWRAAFGADAKIASFGPLMRWAAALVEAALFRAASLDVSRAAFDAFCLELRGKLAVCPHLAELEPPHFVEHQPNRRDFETLAGSSIICFAPLVDDGGGRMRRLDGAESELLFRWLNADLSNRLPGLDPLAAALARQPCHIGQPVDLTPGSDPPHIILRLVIGARFFSTIAMAGERGDAALEAEIADAQRAFDKAELILANWRTLIANAKSEG
ncbi:MAG: hypothetical protein ACLPN5_01755 [Roseiarcus sp.]